MATKTPVIKKTDVLGKAAKAHGLLAEHLPVVVYDVETTGLNNKKEFIIQFSCMRANYDEGLKKYVPDINGIRNIYIKPPVPLPGNITELTGITEEMLADKPGEAEAFPEVAKSFAGAKIFIGYNVKFDNGFIDEMAMRNCGRHFAPVNIVDPCEIARELIARSALKENKYKLANVSEYYKTTVEGFHNAAIDIINTWKVLEAEMLDYEMRREEDERDVFSVVNYLSNFRIIRINRWKQSYGFNSRYDRLYVKTTAGEVVYDLINNKLFPKDGKAPILNEHEFLDQVETVAASYFGLRDPKLFQAGKYYKAV
ncbi:MAG: 3'-5' exonuclease [Oscillospiraceae bacterium]|nr:3'-5' exonuclease [Oscillospiraceae bacterium]